MLIYNTTYHVLTADVRNFLIYVQEVLIPAVEASGCLKNARLTRILSHHEDDSECFSLQFEVADSATLHHWYAHQGARLNADLLKTFKDEIIGIPTLMEIIL